jgi:membrane protein implicated in regulation of membrane protease activity
MRLKKISCYVAGLGTGIFIAIITIKWYMFPLAYAIAFAVLLAFALYLGWVLAFSDTKQPDDEKNRTSKSPKPITMKRKIETTNSSNNS